MGGVLFLFYWGSAQEKKNKKTKVFCKESPWAEQEPLRTAVHITQLSLSRRFPGSTMKPVSHRLCLMPSLKAAFSVIPIHGCGRTNPSSVSLLAWEISQHFVLQAAAACIIQIYCLMKTCTVRVYCCHGTFTRDPNNTHPSLWHSQRVPWDNKDRK